MKGFAKTKSGPLKKNVCKDIGPQSLPLAHSTYLISPGKFCACHISHGIQGMI